MQDFAVTCMVFLNLSRNISVDVVIVSEIMLAVRRSLPSMHKKYEQILNIYGIFAACCVFCPILIYFLCV